MQNVGNSSANAAMPKYKGRRKTRKASESRWVPYNQPTSDDMATGKMFSIISAKCSFLYTLKKKRVYFVIIII